MTDDVSERVVAFLASELGVRPSRLQPEIRLFHDLGCDGDDADELISRFAGQFAVDLTGFDFGSHFGPEAAFNPFVYLYLRLVDSERLRKKPLTVRQLMVAARTKKLRNSDALAV